MADIKGYRSENHSISSGQVLAEAYESSKAKTVILEMADQLSLDLVRKKLVTDQIVLTIDYDVSSAKKYRGRMATDRYGRKVPERAHGTINLEVCTASAKMILQKVGELFDRIVNPELCVRRMYVVANHVKRGEESKPLRQLDIFTDFEKEKIEQEKERRRQEAILEIKAKYGKNAILKGMNFEEGATMRKRNQQVGGHQA